jgi:hypothetical protein
VFVVREQAYDQTISGVLDLGVGWRGWQNILFLFLFPLLDL